MKGTAIIVLVLSVAWLSLVDGHCYVSSPNTRGNQQVTQTACRYGDSGRKRDIDDLEMEGDNPYLDFESRQVPTCSGPCDKKTTDSGIIPPTTIARGTVITVRWILHYHPGGFIRFAWAPFSESDVHANFDNDIYFFMCKETGGCVLSADGTVENDVDCGTNITIPLYLTDGEWTLQWAYFGGYYQAGDYYSCLDFTISGGPTGSKPPIVFNGGDEANPGQYACEYYQTNALHVCTVEPCENGTVPGGPHNGPPLGFIQGQSTTGVPSTGSATSSSTSSTTTSSTTSSTTGVQYSTTTSTSTTGIPPPQYTTIYGLPYIAETGTTGVVGTKWCYVGPAPNLGGPVNSPPTCGTASPNARCNDGQCCSQSGLCGPTIADDGQYYETVDGVFQPVSEAYAYSLYCTNSQADYRQVPCSGSVVSVFIPFLVMAITFVFALF